MDMLIEGRSDMYEVEKIINCKTFKNKKFYLIKWLYYPINESTLEPKSNLKHLNSMIEEFESGYPFSIDQDMFNRFCREAKKSKKFNKKIKSAKESECNIKFTTKKRKIEYFSDTELNDLYLDKLKAHLYINIKRKPIKDLPNDYIIIDLSSTGYQNEDIICNNSSEESNLSNLIEKNDIPKLIMPKLD